MEWLKALTCILLWSTSACSTSTFALQQVRDDTLRTPAPVEDIVYARAFALSQGYLWTGADDEPKTKIGLIVVVRVDSVYVVPQNAPAPILYAGDRMLQPLNNGHTSGHVIGLVPGDVNLSETLFWFGSAISPGRVTPQSIRVERAQAEEAGIRPFSPAKIDSVTMPAIESANLETLLRGELAELVLRYAPEESHLARKWRLPEAKVRQDPPPRQRKE